MEGLTVPQLEELAKRERLGPDSDLSLSGHCHLGQGVEVLFTPGTSSLLLRCHVCKKVAAYVKVAKV